MSRDPKILYAAEDVGASVLRDAENVFDGWYANAGSIDWDEFVDRLADSYGPFADPPYDIECYDSPAVRKIKSYVRKLNR
jgi:hypothetical protein